MTERTREPIRGRQGRGERWPPALALAIALAVYAVLPSDVPIVLRMVVVGLGTVLLVAVLLIDPVRLNRKTNWSRRLSVAQAIFLLAANQVALCIVVHVLLAATNARGPAVLLAALQVWVTNVIAFALTFFELDRGGVVSRRLRSHADLPPADFRFSQDEDAGAVDDVAAGSSERSGWVPGFADYLYFSLTNSMAFSPADTMPLSTRAKALMGLEAFAAFVILALVIARAVSLLG